MTAKPCDHKFIDSKCCLKCGWAPPPRLVPLRVVKTEGPNWQPIDTMPEGVLALTKIDDANGVRNEQELRKQGRLFWVPDGSMYVYYTPTHWVQP